MLPQNRAAVLKIVDEFRGMLVGKQDMFNRCSCCTERSFLQVFEVWPGGDLDPGGELAWNKWGAFLGCPKTRQSLQYIELYNLLEKKKIEEVLFQHFHDIPLLAAIQLDTVNFYRPASQGCDRFLEYLPAAVAIVSNPYRLSLVIDWGKDQDIAICLSNVTGSLSFTISEDNKQVNPLHPILMRLNPEVYSLGPDPLYSFDPDYGWNYQDVLRHIASDEFSFTTVQSNVHTITASRPIRRIHTNTLIHLMRKQAVELSVE